MVCFMPRCTQRTLADRQKTIEKLALDKLHSNFTICHMDKKQSIIFQLTFEIQYFYIDFVNNWLSLLNKQDK
jgi:hypothetical protein